MPQITQTRLTSQNWVLGIDVSSHQNNIDWNAMRMAGIKFAFIKLTEGHEGAGSFDGSVSYNPRARAIAALNNQIKIGYYHLARPGNIQNITQDAELEANNLINHLRGDVFPRPHFPIVLDLETYSSSLVWQRENGIPAPTKNQTKQFAVAFCNRIRQAGYEVMIYVSPSFVSEHLPANHGLQNIPLWVANYRNPNTSMPISVNGWLNNWQIWQYSETESFSGNVGNIDANVMRLDFFNNY